MTSQEAAAHLKELERKINDYYGLNDNGQEVVDMAVEALEKQIPLKPMPYEMGLNGKIEIPCGECGSSLEGYYDYCPFCGQRIFWRGGESE